MRGTTWIFRGALTDQDLNEVDEERRSRVRAGAEAAGWLAKGSEKVADFVIDIFRVQDGIGDFLA